MNIEIANRLVQLRKQNNLSQEDLAAKIGISRQAVSKWERAEASPDTDNLISLARLYHISLDELLKTDEEIVSKAPEENTADGLQPSLQASSVSLENINSQQTAPSSQSTQPAFSLQPVQSAQPENPVPPVQSAQPAQPTQQSYYSQQTAQNAQPTQQNYYYQQPTQAVPPTQEDYYAQQPVQPEQPMPENYYYQQGYPQNYPQQPAPPVTYKAANPLLRLPYPITAVLIYLLLGLFFHLWHPTWMIFLTIPIFDWAIKKNGNPASFPFPVLVALAFLAMGFFFNFWHPGWIIFLSIPIYYASINK